MARNTRWRVVLTAVIVCVLLASSSAAVGARRAGGSVGGVDAGDANDVVTTDTLPQPTRAQPVKHLSAHANTHTSRVHVSPDAAATAAVEDGDAIRMRNAITGTGEPGTVRVVTRARRIPDRVTSLRVTLASATDGTVNPNGFERVEDTASGSVWAWDGRTERPSLAYEMDANDTTGGVATVANDGTYRFVYTGEWGILRTPRIGVTGRYVGPGEIRIERTNRVTGEGKAGASIAVLGPYEEYTAAGSHQRYRLLVPEAASLEPPPEAVFSAFDRTASALRIGGVDKEVFAVAAPTGSVGWAVRGLQTGEADLWVRDGESPDTAADVWTHEYIHTRQAYRAEPSAQWITEASATYYAARLAVDRGAIDYRQFERTLARGTRSPDATAVLTDQRTWRKETPYTKGTLVVGELDRQIRLASDGQASLATVLRSLNDAPGLITNQAIIDAVASAAGASGDADAAAAVRADARRFTTTRAVPAPWSQRAHAEAFGATPAQIGYRMQPDGVEATGPYRNRSVARDPVQLVVGETLAVSLNASNTGGKEGAYDVAMTVDDETVDERRGRLDPNEHANETLTHSFDTPGTHTVRLGSETLTVVVTEPAPVQVRAVETSVAQAASGETVQVLAQVENDAVVPADATLEFRVDADTVARRSVRLDVGAEATVEETLTLAGDGRQSVTVSVIGPTSEASTTVRLIQSAGAVTDGEGGEAGGGEGKGEEEEQTANDTPANTDDSMPGLSVLATVIALIAASGLATRRRQ